MYLSFNSQFDLYLQLGRRAYKSPWFKSWLYINSRSQLIANPVQRLQLYHRKLRTLKCARSVKSDECCFALIKILTIRIIFVGIEIISQKPHFEFFLATCFIYSINLNAETFLSCIKRCYYSKHQITTLVIF